MPRTMRYVFIQTFKVISIFGKYALAHILTFYRIKADTYMSGFQTTLYKFQTTQFH
jgi:hypothetical protein